MNLVSLYPHIMTEQLSTHLHTYPHEWSSTTAHLSHTTKVMLKILQARLQKYMNWEHMFKLDFLERSEEPEIKLTTSAGS